MENDTLGPAHSATATDFEFAVEPRATEVARVSYPAIRELQALAEEAGEREAAPDAPQKLCGACRSAPRLLKEVSPRKCSATALPFLQSPLDRLARGEAKALPHRSPGARNARRDGRRNHGGTRSALLPIVLRTIGESMRGIILQSPSATSGESLPTFAKKQGVETVDGGITWKNIGKPNDLGCLVFFVVLGLCLLLMLGVAALRWIYERKVDSTYGAKRPWD
jgi:hypothetical protein